MATYSVLIEKLDSFIRKYYKSRLYKGLLYASALIFGAFLFIASLEYYAYMGTVMRTILFYSFIGLLGFVLWKYIFEPLAYFYRWRKTISYDEAARIIGQHFESVSDKLLNTLQLQANLDTGYSDLLEASIDQKIRALSPVPFASAVNLNENKKYIKYAAVPVLVLLVIAVARPTILTESTKRILKHSTEFERPAPFQFNVKNKSLSTAQQKDFELLVEMTGEVMPASIFIEIGENRFILQKNDKAGFSYTFKSPQKTVDFRLFADGFYSKPLSLSVLPNPQVLHFEVNLDYPAYLGKAKELLQNTGDLVVPEGTRATWTFFTSNTDKMKMAIADTAFAMNATDKGFSFSMRMKNSFPYVLLATNSFIKSPDSIKYAVSVIADQTPGIQVDQKQDSLHQRQFYFRGLVKDDYGFSKLFFCYRKTNEAFASNASLTSKTVSTPIAINLKSTQNDFFHYVDFSTLNLDGGEQIEYYFEVWDNDGVNGAKSARSQMMVYKAPTLQELSEKTNSENKALKNDISEAIKEARQMQKETNELNKKLLQQKSMNWEDKQKAQDLMEKQKELQKKAENISEQLKENNTRQNEFKQEDEKILEKQKQLEELMESLKNDELKKLMEDMQKLMEKLDKNQLQEKLDEMKLDNKSLEKELDRSLELFKQLEFEQKLQENIERLDKLAEEQKELSKKTEEKGADSKEQLQKQEELSKKFDELKKDMKDLEKKDKEMEQPNGFKNPEDSQQKIDEEQKKSEEQLKQNKNKKAAESQKGAAEEMEKMSQGMKEQQAEMEKEQAEEDSGALRTLLENLLQLSFAQEQLIKSVQTTPINSPEFLKLGKKQREIKDDAKMIEDSLLALSKRVPEIKPIVNREISAVNQSIEKSLAHLEAREIPQALNREQLAMTSVNNLALLLNEALQQMVQKQRQQSKSKSGQCKKPSPGKGENNKPMMSMQKMRQMQEKLNKEMQKMKEGQGEQQGQKPGKKPGGQQGGMSEQLAKMAAMQQAIRQEMEKYNKEFNKDGKNKMGNLDKLGEAMEQTETDIVNKKISQETQRRQQDILTRLLEAEKAERERDMDKERESNEAKSQINRNPLEFEKYKREKLKEVEFLRSVPPSLNSFYRKKALEYFQLIAN